MCSIQIRTELALTHFSYANMGGLDSNKTQSWDTMKTLLQDAVRNTVMLKQPPGTNPNLVSYLSTYVHDNSYTSVWMSECVGDSNYNGSQVIRSWKHWARVTRVTRARMPATARMPLPL
jgi:hypothetical protein